MTGRTRHWWLTQRARLRDEKTGGYTVFQYYIPGASKGLTRTELDAIDLGYMLDDGETHAQHVEVIKGPDGKKGAVIASHSPTPEGRIGYYPDEQEWRQAPGRSWWVGMWTAEKPTPDTLRRKSQLDGHFVLLGDERQWLCPVARALHEGDDGQLHAINPVPKALDLDADGNWTVSGDAGRYAHLWPLAKKWLDAINGGTEDPVDGVWTWDWEDTADTAVTCLQANYRIGKLESVMLGLLDGATTTQVVQTLVDHQTWQAWMAKKATAQTPQS